MCINNYRNYKIKKDISKYIACYTRMRYVNVR